MCNSDTSDTSDTSDISGSIDSSYLGDSSDSSDDSDSNDLLATPYNLLSWSTLIKHRALLAQRNNILLDSHI